MSAPASMARRSAVFAPRGAMATSHPLATGAGMDVFRRGGNAVDAAVTAAIVLTVVEPHMTGLGGDLFALIRPAREARLLGLCGNGRSGSLMTPGALEEAGCREVPLRGALPVTVPGSARAWEELLERYGTLSLRDALEPAIVLAEEGFPVSPVVASDWRRHEGVLRTDEGASTTYLVDGRAPRAGEWFRNPDYAGTLRTLADDGADALYEGELGERVVEAVRAGGGFLTRGDLQEHRSRWVEPISAPFRGVRLWQIPPPGQGIAALQMLRLLEPFPLEEMGPNSAEALHLLVEAKKLAYADLARYVGDPRHMELASQDLLDEGYVEERRRALDPERAAERVEPGPALSHGETVYLAAADREGTMVSLINSVFHAFGSGLVVPGTGFHLQNRGAGFTMEPGRPNTVAPRKEPFHTIIPGFATRPDAGGTERPWLAFGVMGGPMQPQGQVQVLLNLLLFGMDPQEALDAARVRHHEGLRLAVEPPIEPDVREELARRGHEVEPGPARDMGGGQIVARLDRGWAAGSDPRKDGQAAGH